MSSAAKPSLSHSELTDADRRAILLRTAATEHALPDQPQLIAPDEYDILRSEILAARTDIDRIIRRQLGIPPQQPPGVYGVDTQRPQCYPHGFCGYINTLMIQSLRDSLAARTAPLIARIADRMAGRSHLLREVYGIGTEPNGSRFFENYIQLGDCIIDSAFNTIDGYPAPLVVPYAQNPYTNIVSYTEHAAVAAPYWRVQVWPMTYFAPRLAAFIPTLYTHAHWIRSGGSNGTLAEAAISNFENTRPLADPTHELWRGIGQPSAELRQQVRARLGRLADHPLCTPPETTDPWAETQRTIEAWEMPDMRAADGITPHEYDVTIERLTAANRAASRISKE